MKCRYKYCKYGGEVKKEDSIQEGKSYYHKQCYEEKNDKKAIEEYYIVNFPSCIISVLRKVINQLIYDKKLDTKFILYMLKYIKKNDKPINNPFGLLNYCTNTQIIEEYKKKKILEKYKKIGKLKSDDDSVKFTYKISDKKDTDII